MSFCSGRPGEEYYTCNTYKKKGKNYCSSHYLKYSEVYKAVLADIRDTLRIVQRDKDAFVEAVLKHIDNTATKQRSQLEREARELKKRVDDLEARFDRMYEVQGTRGQDRSGTGSSASKAGRSHVNAGRQRRQPRAHRGLRGEGAAVHRHNGARQRDTEHTGRHNHHR